MPTLNELAATFGIKYDMTKERTELSGTLSSILGLVDGARSATWQNDSNRSNFEDKISSGSSQGVPFDTLWAGLTTGNFDIKDFMATQDELEKNGFGDRIKNLFGTKVSKRKRMQDDADGEFNNERRYEFNPYDRMKRTEYIEKRLTIDFESCFPGGVSARAMRNCGARVWAVIRILEDLGFMVAVNYIKNNEHNRIAKKGEPEDWYCATEIKASSEYMHPATLAAAFDPAFYRRINWMLMAVGHDLTNGQVDSGLGSPRCSDVPCKYTGNSTIVLTSNIDTLSLDKLEDKLIEALQNHITKGDTSTMQNYHAA